MLANVEQIEVSPVPPSTAPAAAHAPYIDPAFAPFIGRTIPALFREQAGNRGARTALRTWSRGLWREVSWTAYAGEVDGAAWGLLAAGQRPGDAIAVFAGNLPEWLYCDLGNLSIGGMTVGIYPTESVRQIAFVLNDCKARIAFTDTGERLAKLLAAKAQCPTLETIVAFDKRIAETAAGDGVMSYTGFLNAGREHAKSHLKELEQRLAAIDPESAAIIIYTSGTTGEPKGAMISHRNMIFNAWNSTRYLPVGFNEEMLSFSPLCHISERSNSIIWPLLRGSTTNFVPEGTEMLAAIRQVEPTFVNSAPRTYEKMYAELSGAVAKSTWRGRAATSAALTLGERIAKRRLAGGAERALDNLLFRLADLLVLAKLKKAMGLSRARMLLSGAAPISLDLIRWYMSLGLDMREIYGMTETATIAIQRPGRIKAGTVGEPVPGLDLKLAEDGEILVRSGSVFRGYLNKPEKTAEALDGGYMHTGDLGEIDADGYLRIVGRKKDIIITAGGKNISPANIENLLKFSPYIGEAVVIGDRRKYLTCLIAVDEANVRGWLAANGHDAGAAATLARDETVRKLVASEIDVVNKQLARVETIKKWTLLDKAFQLGGDEVTSTMKLKRTVVMEKYAGLIEEMYRGGGD